MTIEERLLEYQKKYLSYEQELTDLVTDWLQKGLDAENIDDWRTKQELIEINEDYKKQEIYQRNNRALLIQAAALVYELGVLKKYAEPIIMEIDEDNSFYSERQRLLKFLSYFLTIEDESDIPNTSILREFIGGSCFE